MPFSGQCNASETGKGLAESAPNACTSAGTSNAETGTTLTVEALAAALLGLSPADRARLAAMLLGQQRGQAEG
jgi:hypothetical protein